MTPWKRPLRLLSTAVLAVALAAGPAPLLAQESAGSSEPAAGKSDPATQKKKDEGEAKEAPGMKSAEAAAEALRTEGTVVAQHGDLELAVDANFFSEFPGFELGGLSEPQRTWLLERANHVYCTCGCRGDTVARCVVMDPTCQTARKMMQALLDKAQTLTPEEAAAPPAPEPEAQP